MTEVTTKLDIVLAWLLVLALCGGIFALAALIERGAKFWHLFWKAFRWQRINASWARWVRSI